MSAATRRFYGRWTRAYDLLATRAPWVGAVRERAADALALDPGDAVLDLGCGTGAAFPALREGVGPDGLVVGVDLTGPMLARARDRAARWDNVHVVRGDAARAPVVPVGAFDAVHAAFLTGLLDDPAGAVADWLDLLAPGGRLVLVDGTPNPDAGPLSRGLFRALVWAGAPGKFRREESAARALGRRVDAAHGALAARAATEESRALRGFLRVTAGRP